MKYYLSVILLLVFLLTSKTAFAQDISVSVNKPAKNEHFEACNNIFISAEVTVTTGSVRQVIFYTNGKTLRTVRNEPYETTFENVPDGVYEIQAKAVNTSGGEALSDPFYVYVGNVEPGNVILNGEFNCALSPWFLDNYEGAQSTAEIIPDLLLTEDASGVMIDITEQGLQYWGVQLMQPFKVIKDHTYKVSFYAEADDAKEIEVNISKNYDDYAPVYGQTYTVENPEKYGPFSFTAVADDDNMMFKFVLGGNTIPIFLDAVVVVDQNWTRVQKNVSEDIESFSLKQNFPNPFNPSTQINFYLDNPGDFDLSIFDILGRKIKSHSGFAKAGPLSYIWDGTNFDGNPCPSGIYLYSLKTESRSMTRKMQLLR